MRTLGIDFGERRIGLAVSDPEGRFALPLETVERRDDRSAIARLLEIAEREGVESLVVGEPRRPADGGETEAGRRARRFGERLGRASGLPVEWIRIMRRAISTVGPRFSANRMLRDYLELAYLPLSRGPRSPAG